MNICTIHATQTVSEEIGTWTQLTNATAQVTVNLRVYLPNSYRSLLTSKSTHKHTNKQTEVQA
jgi:hypothetical protein